MIIVRSKTNKYLCRVGRKHSSSKNDAASPRKNRSGLARDATQPVPVSRKKNRLDLYFEAAKAAGLPDHLPPYVKGFTCEYILIVVLSEKV